MTNEGVRLTTREDNRIWVIEIDTETAAGHTAQRVIGSVSEGHGVSLEQAITELLSDEVPKA